MKLPNVKFATIYRLFFLAMLPFWVAAGANAAGYKLPLFREVDRLISHAPTVIDKTPVRLLTDNAFPPYSFPAQSGGPAGLAVELALAACGAAQITCEVVPLPFDNLLAALRNGEGDVVISGLRLDAATLDGSTMTRPWFRTMGRFVVQSGSPLASADAVLLAGKRIGVTKDTLHARWLERFYGKSTVVAFDDEAAARVALRSGNVDALFGDNLRSIYWVASGVSQDCCRLLGGAYSDFDYFSRNLAFVVRGGRADLRAAFDFGLDAAQSNGSTERIFNAYVPLSPW